MAKHPLENIADLSRTAREEAARMFAATDGRTDGDVRMSVEQFRKLAALLASLGKCGGACGGADCLGAPVDGIRTWVTRDALARGQDRYARLPQHGARAAGDLTF